jgi:ribose transport system substrate-binding protein
MQKPAPMKLRAARGALFALASIAMIGVSGAALAMAPLADRPQPVANASGVTAKIAMIGFANNPYWVSVEKGAETANKVLSSRGGQVKWIVAGADINVPTVNQAIRAAAIQGYNGIGFFIAGEGNCAVVKQMVAKNIAMGA